MNAWKRSAAVWWLVAIAGTCAPAPAPAQPAADAPATPTASAATAPPETDKHAAYLNDQVADWLTRVALVDLRVNPLARERDFRIASIMLRDAHARRPDDLTILRLAIDAATQAGDGEAAIALTRDLVKADPADTRAQLSLIAARVNQQQTIEGRLAMLARFLGPEGERIDPSIRSRLALDAAMLCRERGDEAGFVQRLSEATALDATNKDAAALAYTYFSQRVADDAAQFELLTNLMKADPMDADTRTAMGRLLSRAGAHQGAKRFFAAAIKLKSVTRAQPGIQLRADALRTDWMVDGSRATIDFITAEVQRPRRELQAMIDDAKSRGAPTDSIPEPGNFRLSPALELIRCLAASAIDDAEMIDQSLGELAGSVGMYKGWVEGTLRRPESTTPEAAQREYDAWAPELVFVRLWVGRGLDGIEAEIDALRAAGLLTGARLERVNAFAALRRGDLDGARQRLETMKDEPQARAGLAIVHELKGEREAAQAVLRALAVDACGTLVGSWAAMKIEHATKAIPAPPQAGTLQAMAQGVPELFDAFIASPRLFMALFLDVPQRTIGPLGRAMIRVRLVNRSPVPLAVGAERPINSRLLLSSETDIAGVRSFADSSPEVLNLDHRLRLMPREEVAATVWADHGFGAWSLSYGTGAHVQRRFRALQGFMLNESAVPIRGGMCLEADSAPLTRGQLPNLKTTDDEWPAVIASAQGEPLALALAAVRLRLISSGTADGALPVAAARMAEALLARYQAGSTLDRLLILLNTPTGLQNAVAGELDRGLRNTPDTDPMVLLVKLITRAVDSSDPGFAAAKACGNPDVAEAAALIEQRLGEVGVRTYSRLTSFRKSGTGPTDE